jgi:hypothetical protein
MASYTPTVSIDDPRTSTGGNGVLPPDWGGGENFGFFDTRLRRARLGLVVGLTGIAMIFISFTSAYVVRQGLPTRAPTNCFTIGFPCRCPGCYSSTPAYC